MVSDRAASAARKTQAEGRTPTVGQSRHPDRNPVCAQDRHSLGNVASGNGLWQRHDLLATLEGMACRRGLGATPPGLARTLAGSRAARLVPRCLGCRDRAGAKKGAGTGPNPTDRGKSGTKRHLVVDARGTPLAIETTAANVHEVTQAERMVDAIPAVAGRCGRPRCRPTKLHADKAYASAAFRRQLRQRRIMPRIARRGIESKERLGRQRWVVERTFAWLNQYRRLRIRYERRQDIHDAFLRLGCALVCWKQIQRFC